MKFVVYGPNRRLGLVQDDLVIDVAGASAKQLVEAGERRPSELAAATAPGELGAFIEAGERAIEAAARAVEHVLQRASERTGVSGNVRAVLTLQAAFAFGAGYFVARRLAGALFGRGH